VTARRKRRAGRATPREVADECYERVLVMESSFSNLRSHVQSELYRMNEELKGMRTRVHNLMRERELNTIQIAAACEQMTLVEIARLTRELATIAEPRGAQIHKGWREIYEGHMRKEGDKS
jgi:hypothetical protein